MSNKNVETVEALFRIPNQVAVIVGGSRGIGRSTAMLFANAGAAVVVADVDGEGARVVATAIEANGGRARSFRVDVTDAASVSALGDFTLAEFGRLNILVNTAAIFRLERFEDATVETWDETSRVNLRGVYLTTQMAVRLMKQAGGGAIVNFSSLAAITPSLFDQAHYDAQKAGVLALTRAVAAEFASDGIRANCVVPGAVMTEGAGDYAAWPTRGPITQAGRIPLGRAGQPAELAAAALFLASPAAAVITGQQIVADGGYLIG